jgi:hypothetical protein
VLLAALLVLAASLLLLVLMEERRAGAIGRHRLWRQPELTTLERCPLLHHQLHKADIVEVR